MLGLQTAACPGPRPSWTCPWPRVLALLSWQPAGIAGLDPAHGGDQGGPIVPGGGGQSLRDRPRGHAGRSTRPPWPAAAATRRRRPDPHRPGPPHRLPGRAGGRRRRGPAMTGRSGAVHRAEAAAGAGRRRRVRGRGHRRRARRRGGHRGGGVQHRALRLPGGHHRSRPTPARSSPSPIPTSATTGSTPPTTRRPDPTAGGSSSATCCDRPSNWRSTEIARGVPGPALGSRASPGSTPGGSPGTSATRAPCPAPSAPPAEADLAGRRGRGRRPPTGATWCRR